MTNQGRFIFLVVFVLSSLLIQYCFSFTEFELKNVVSTIIAGIVAILIISFCRIERKNN